MTNLVIALFESLLTQALPYVFSVNTFGFLESDIQVATFNSEIKPGRFVLYKV